MWLADGRFSRDGAEDRIVGEARLEGRARRVVAGLALAVVLAGGCVRERCYRDLDCPAPKICTAEGACAWKCTSAAECGPGFDCVDHACRPMSVVPDAPGDVTGDVQQPEPECPDDMVLVARAFCLDRYEASRPDATAVDAGTSGVRSTSRAGVLPWRVADNAAAAAACVAAGKRLCTPVEWECACRGPGGTEYPYGNAYLATTCNGIDAFGEGGFHLAPTGSFPGCTNGYGAYDLSGNLWEHVAGGDDRTIRGGAFNCLDSPALHRCGYVPGTWAPSARGFRCCAAPTWPEVLPEGPDEPFRPDLPGPADAADVPDMPGPVEAADVADVPVPADEGPDDDGGGCLDPDVPDADLGSSDPGPADPGPRDPGPWDPGSDDPGLPDPGQADPGVFDPGPVDPGLVDPGPDDPGALDPGPRPRCLSDMVPVAPSGITAWCLDRYEASRDDATATSAGTSSRPTSRAGVLPWQGVTLEVASGACLSVGKRLCTPAEWRTSCEGRDGTVYGYGNAYAADTCNGIDAFCDCAGVCAGVAACPYPHCRAEASPAGDGGPCGASFHVVPTGSFPACTNEWGAFDLNGNVWEVVDHGDGIEHFHGGAYNCGDSEALHRCDYNATWGPSARGFRCCADAGAP